MSLSDEDNGNLQATVNGERHKVLFCGQFVAAFSVKWTVKWSLAGVAQCQLVQIRVFAWIDAATKRQDVQEEETSSKFFANLVKISWSFFGPLTSCKDSQSTIFKSVSSKVKV